MSHEKKLSRFKSSEYFNDLNSLRKAFKEKIDSVPPTMEYVRNLVLDAKMIFRILTDPEFDLSEEAREDFTAALWYFIRSERNTIPDWVPIIGYCDDYRLIRYVKEKHREEIERYFESTKFFIANYF